MRPHRWRAALAYSGQAPDAGPGLLGQGPMCFAYILRCADHSLYVGHTRNIERRVETHNAGRGAAFTSKRRPVELVYAESHDTETAAILSANAN